MIRAIDRALAAVSWTAAALVLVLLFAGPSLIGAEKDAAPAQGGPPPQEEPAPAEGGEAPAEDGEAPADGGEAPDGAAVFASAGCGGCHTLAAAGSSGAIGPNLDDAAPAADAVAAIVRSGSGAMPAFEGRLSDAEIEAVAAFVAGGG